MRVKIVRGSVCVCVCREIESTCKGSGWECVFRERERERDRERRVYRTRERDVTCVQRDVRRMF